MAFGDFLKQKRLEVGLTLRKFSENKGYDAAYISRLENNILPAPADSSKVHGLATALNIDEGTPEWVEFFDLAAASRNELPEDIHALIPTPEFLPAFYRTLRRDKVSREQIDELLNLIKGGDKE